MVFIYYVRIVLVLFYIRVGFERGLKKITNKGKREREREREEKIEVRG